MIRAALALGLLPGIAMAETTYELVTYGCERGVEMSAAYVNSEETSFAVVLVEGRQVVLEIERSGSGARYGWPSGGSHYVWWTKGEEATLFWHDGETGEETVLLAGCVAGL